HREVVVGGGVRGGGGAVAVADRRHVRGVVRTGGTESVDGRGQPLTSVFRSSLGDGVPVNGTFGSVVAEPEHRRHARAVAVVTRTLVEVGGVLYVPGGIRHLGLDAGNLYRDVVGGVEIAHGDGHPPIPVEGIGVVEPERAAGAVIGAGHDVVVGRLQ